MASSATYFFFIAGFTPITVNNFLKQEMHEEALDDEDGENSNNGDVTDNGPISNIQNDTVRTSLSFKSQPVEEPNMSFASCLE